VVGGVNDTVDRWREVSVTPLTGGGRCSFNVPYFYEKWFNQLEHNASIFQKFYVLAVCVDFTIQFYSSLGVNIYKRIFFVII
jgi:hypothetical protein